MITFHRVRFCSCIQMDSVYVVHLVLDSFGPWWKKLVVKEICNKNRKCLCQICTVPMSWGNTPPPQPSCPVLLRLRSPNLSWRLGDVMMCAIVARLQIAHMNAPISFVAFGSLDRTAVWWAILLVVHAFRRNSQNHSICVAGSPNLACGHGCRFCRNFGTLPTLCQL